MTTADDARPVPGARRNSRWGAPGTAGAALRHRRFRAVFFGGLASNTGSWMQNVTLAAWAFSLTGSETFVSLVVFAQLGPMLLFTLAGGALADLLDRRRLIMVVTTQQALFALLLAWLASQPDPSRIGILGCVLAIGIGQSVSGPTFSSLLPTLVPRQDLPGAISLQSVNLNASRVIGPAIGGVILGLSGPSAVFVLNAVSYSAIIVVVWRLRFPPVAPDTSGASGLRRILGGFSVARADPIVARCLGTMALFSFFCLPFVTQMPAIAERNLGLNPESASYGALYAVFAFGALLGALSVGTVFAGRSYARLARAGLVGFAVTMAIFALLRTAWIGYPIVAAVGFAYFVTVTSLSTVLQSRIKDNQRGRVMAVWMMAFGGTVPIGALVFGPMMEFTSVTTVMLIGAVGAVALLAVARLDAPPRIDTRPGLA
jgi:MFS family permease